MAAAWVLVEDATVSLVQRVEVTAAAGAGALEVVGVGSGVLVDVEPTQVPGALAPHVKAHVVHRGVQGGPLMDLNRACDALLQAHPLHTSACCHVLYYRKAALY